MATKNGLLTVNIIEKMVRLLFGLMELENGTDTESVIEKMVLLLCMVMEVRHGIKTAKFIKILLENISDYNDIQNLIQILNLLNTSLLRPQIIHLQKPKNLPLRPNSKFLHIIQILTRQTILIQRPSKFISLITHLNIQTLITRKI